MRMSLSIAPSRYLPPQNSDCHPTTMITADAAHRFVSDTEKSTWNGKASTAVAAQSANGLMSAVDKLNAPVVFHCAIPVLSVARF